MKPSLVKQIAVSAGAAALIAAVWFIGFYPVGPKYRIAADGNGHYTVMERFGPTRYLPGKIHDLCPSLWSVRWHGVREKQNAPCLMLQSALRDPGEEMQRDLVPYEGKCQAAGGGSGVAGSGSTVH